MTDDELQMCLQAVLRLDSVYNIMSFAERMNVRGYMLGWYWAVLPAGVIKLVENIELITMYEAMNVRVGVDRLCYVNGILQHEYVDKTSSVREELWNVMNVQL